MSIALFDKLALNPVKHQDEIIKILKEDIDSVIASDFATIEESLFMVRSVEVRCILMTNKTIFWAIYYYLGDFNIPNITTENQRIQSELLQNGIVIIKNFFSSSELEEIRQEYTEEFSNLPELSTEQKKHQYDKRSTIFWNESNTKRFDYGNEYHARIRIAYKEHTRPPILNQIALNPDILKIVRDYSRCDDAKASNIIYEQVTTPRFYREDRAWHIDTLMDQFKIMIALNDVTLENAPFTYIPGYHRQFTPKQESRYHHMYANGGYQAGMLHHFEEDFAQDAHLQSEPFLKAGDIVAFDSRIQHSTKYAYNNTQRDNIMVYFSTLRTKRNRFLGRVDHYLKTV